jgi:hypothetical protein
MSIACGNAQGLAAANDTPLTPAKVSAQSSQPAVERPVPWNSGVNAKPAAPTPAPAPGAPAAAPAPTAAAAPKPGSIEEALHYDPADPLANLEAADVLDRGAAHRAPPRSKPVAARSCAVHEEPRRVWSKPGIATLTALGSGYVLAGYTRSGDAEQLFVVHVTESGKLEPVATLPLSVPHPGERVAPPGLAAESSHQVTVAYTDGSGSLFMQRLRVGAAQGGGSAALLAKGVDTRFAPAVDHGPRGALIAYTLGTTPMHSMLVRFDPKGEVLATHDITPAAMGAAAPAFVQGASPRALVTADARSGMSPIARTLLDAEGKPATADLIAPVGMMTQPPQLAAADAGFGAYVLYSGLGSAATSAVGLLKIAPKATGPEAFVKGTAYGALHSAAVALPSAIVMAADAPLAPGKQPKHDMQVVLLDARGQGPTTLHVPAPSGDATHVALARGGEDQVGFSFSAPDGVYWGTLRCTLAL